MTTEPTDLRETIARALEGEGLHPNPDQYDSSIHGWRCEYPDRYGPCTCFQECVDTVQAIVREAQAEAWDEAVTETITEWADHIKDSPEAAKYILYSTNPYRETGDSDEHR